MTDERIMRRDGSAVIALCGWFRDDPVFADQYNQIDKRSTQ